MTDFYIDNHDNDINQSTVDKIQNLLNNEEIYIEKEEFVQFAKLGKFLENNELTEPFVNLHSEYEQNMTEENVISLIQQKLEFNIAIEELKTEISFISKNFTKFINKLIELGKDTKYFSIIDCIVKNENMQLESEDELLLFILQLCEQNKIYELLFQYIWLEYCSVEAISQFIDYTNKNVFKDIHVKSIINCINRRLLQEQIPIQKIMSKRDTVLNQFIIIMKKIHSMVFSDRSF